MVFSTLHTNDAPSTVTRLRDMGVEPFLITATRRGASWPSGWCADLRRLPDRIRAEPGDAHGAEPAARPTAKGKKFYYGKGCDNCNNTGYRGRTGMYELLVMNDDLRDMIAADASTDQLRDRLPQAGHARRCASQA